MAATEFYLRKINPHYLHPGDKVYIIPKDRQRIIIATVMYENSKIYFATYSSHLYMKDDDMNLYSWDGQMKYYAYAIVSNSEIIDRHPMIINTNYAMGTPEIHMLITQKHAKDVKIGTYIGVNIGDTIQFYASIRNIRYINDEMLRFSTVYSICDTNPLDDIISNIELTFELGG
jgi:hypothetical protein